MAKKLLIIIGAGLLLFGASCKTEHRIEVAPMELNINVNIKVDKALDDFFGDLDELQEEAPAPDKQAQ